MDPFCPKNPVPKPTNDGEKILDVIDKANLDFNQNKPQGW